MDRRAFLAALAAVPMAPLLTSVVPDHGAGVSIRFVRQWISAPYEPLGFHRYAFALTWPQLTDQRLPVQRFDPARLPQ